MQEDNKSVEFYTHLNPSPCSYLPEKDCNSIFLDPTIDLSEVMLNRLHLNGFRRSGRLLYRPQCENCRECRSSRIINHRFSPGKSTKRTLSRNRDTELLWRAPKFDTEHYELYERYINSRHGDGDMAPADEEQYRGFLVEGQNIHHHLELRSKEGALLGVCVVDLFLDGLSAVYSFFDPELDRRSIGKYFILKLIAFGLERGLPYTYLGYYVQNSPKMSYKASYRPLEIFDGAQWVELINTD